MSGLTLTLKPREKFLVGGNLLENGPRRASIRIAEETVFVLRLSDALHPDDVTTPVRRAYHAAQRILACELTEDQGRAELLARMDALAPIFAKAGETPLVDRILNAIAHRRYYGVLVGLRTLMALEMRMLGLESENTYPELVKNVG